MNLKNILIKTGTAIFKTAVPNGGAILEVVNSFLPNDKKLNTNATGNDIKTAVELLPPDIQASIMLKSYDVEIAEINNWSKIQNSLSNADSTGNSTRPFIAKLMAFVVAFSIVVFISILAYAIYDQQIKMVKALADSWPMLIAILGTPTTLLTAYFGMRTKEKKARYAAAAGQPLNLLGSLKQLIK